MLSQGNGNIIHNFGKFLLFLNWEGADIRPQIWPKKIPVININILLYYNLVQAFHYIIIRFLINMQVQGHHPNQWDPFQVTG